MHDSTGNLILREHHKNNKREGLLELYYDGTLAIRQEYKMVLHGVYEDFDEKGNLISQSFYKNGIEI